MENTNAQENKPVANGIVKAIDDAHMKNDVPVVAVESARRTAPMGRTEQAIPSSPDPVKPSIAPAVVLPTATPNASGPLIVATVAAPPNTNHVATVVIDAALTTVTSP
jgi:hypothetical protein